MASAPYRDVALACIGLLLASIAVFACSDNRTPAGSGSATDPMFECIPNLDGQIDALELPLALDLAVDYTVSEGAAVNVAGTVDSAGRRVWDFSDAGANAARIELAAEAIAGKWYASSLAGATFVVPAADPAGLDGAYIRDESGLFIVGLASPEPDPPGGQTLLVYDAPVLLLRFPVTSGDAYSSSSDVTGGTLNGLPYNGTDTYDVQIDGVGRAELPDVTFTQAFRVRTDVEIAPAVGGVTTSRKQVSFFFECFGEVVRVMSRPDEPNADFTNAAEVRRFAL